ncbi:MAG TPA: DoxX family protein [candidate division Zixibacteria bacterium]|nr:DoxX family protein [candidate division Zixibacteria bacterium]
MFKFTEKLDNTLWNVGLLVLRATTGLLLAFGHGWGKLSNYSEMSTQFADPFGFGMAASLGMTFFAEFFCAIAVALGILARVATLPLIIMFLTIVLLIHGEDPWAKKEFALLYLIPFLTILLTGPGKYSLDNLIFKWKRPE